MCLDGCQLLAVTSEVFRYQIALAIFPKLAEMPGRMTSAYLEIHFLHHVRRGDGNCMF